MILEKIKVVPLFFATLVLILLVSCRGYKRSPVEIVHYNEGAFLIPETTYVWEISHTIKSAYQAFGPQRNKTLFIVNSKDKLALKDGDNSSYCSPGELLFAYFIEKDSIYLINRYPKEIRFSPSSHLIPIQYYFGDELTISKVDTSISHEHEWIKYQAFYKNGLLDSVNVEKKTTVEF